MCFWFSSSRSMDDDPKSTASISQDTSKISNRLRIKPMSLMTGTITSNLAKQNIREVSCVGVPFFKAPGSNRKHFFIIFLQFFEFFSTFKNIRRNDNGFNTDIRLFTHYRCFCMGFKVFMFWCYFYFLTLAAKKKLYNQGKHISNDPKT